VRVARSVMSSTEDRVALARVCLAFAGEIAQDQRR
jgi:hypothetical protein